MGFYKDRDYLKNEYQNARWDKSTGIEPEEIERKMKEFIADKNTPTKAIQRAKLLEMLIENAQLELNPHSLFPDKINNGVRYGKVASFGIFGKICFIAVALPERPVVFEALPVQHICRSKTENEYDQEEHTDKYLITVTQLRVCGHLNPR